MPGDKKKIDWRKQRLVYQAIERDSFSDDAEISERAEKAFNVLMDKTISVDEFNHFLNRETDFRALGGWDGEWDTGRNKNHKGIKEKTTKCSISDINLETQIQKTVSPETELEEPDISLGFY